MPMNYDRKSSITFFIPFLLFIMEACYLIPYNYCTVVLLQYFFKRVREKKNEKK